MTNSSDRVSGFVRDLGDAARSNPISAALIGMGAVWLLAGRSETGSRLLDQTGIGRLPDRARDAWEGTASGVRSGARQLGDTAQGATDRLAETGEQFVRSAAEQFEILPDRAETLFDDVRQNLSELFEKQPLAVGAIGIAIGAAIAVALPTTDMEAEYLGESSEFVRQKASEVAGEQINRAVDVGAKVVDAVSDEAREQGLTVDGLQSAASELSSKAARVAGAATGKQQT